LPLRNRLHRPECGARQLVSFVGIAVISTSFGWMGTATVTTGNNVGSRHERR
jgi:hypothetical protein